MSGLDRTAAVLIDGHIADGLLGEPAGVRHLRIKPGLSTSAALVRAGDPGDYRGWVRVAAPGHHDKLRSGVRRSQERGRTVLLAPVEQCPGLLLAHGGPLTDPWLVRALEAAPADALERARVLRHNPHRRLVLLDAEADVVLRVTAHRHDRLVERSARLARLGVPVLPPEQQQHPKVSRWPRYGHGSLESWPADLAAAAEAGDALARLHRADDPDLPVLDAARVAASLAAAVGVLDHVAPELAAPARRLAAAVHRRCCAATGPPVLLHGDFSADQVLLGAAGVRLIDLDRMVSGQAVADLGSLVATTAGPSADALLEGYRRAGMPLPDAHLAAWTAYAMLLRVGEPLRIGAPDLTARLLHRLDRVREVLA